MTEQAPRVLVIGDGAWGTALALLLDDNGAEVTVWGHDTEYAQQVQNKRENTSFLPGYKLPERITFTGEPDAIIRTDLVVAAVPTKFARSVYTKFAELYNGAPVVCAAKGMEAETGETSSVMLQKLWDAKRICVLSGPSHAEEVAKKMPASVVVAGEDEKLSEYVQKLMSNEYFRIYTNDDRIGVELCGPVKNVIAIASGICDGLGLGDNAKSALITRGMEEMRRLLEAAGASPTTATGLAGLGDLVTTSISPFGRNRKVGLMLAEGKRLDEIVGEMEAVAEGITTTRPLLQMAERNEVEMPICSTVSAVLFKGLEPSRGVKMLMTRDLKSER